ncbi:RnfABCDGE type electron transport complex subunit D [Candidatus Daviesbacteria bacterium]|nr:RnfABCDGE type electron transport complex subunit D [Candidatus Daviesbacteria bacterium]
MRLPLNSQKSFVLVPKVQLALILSLINLTALIHSFSLNTLLNLMVALVSAVISDLIFLKVRNIKPFFPGAAIVSGLIIALLVSPDQPLFIPAFAAVLAMFSKNFIRVGNRHIFNPAAFGLFLSGLLLTFQVSWWGVSFQQIFPLSINSFYLLMLLLPATVSILKLNRHWNIFSFYIVYLAIYIWLNFDRGVNLTSLVDPVVVFFALVMLPEPMTTPVNYFRQMLFGGFVAATSFAVSGLPVINTLIPDSLIIALLMGNLVFFKIR